MNGNGKATWNLHIWDLSFFFAILLDYNKKKVVKQGVTTTQGVNLITKKDRAIIDSI